MKYNINPNNNSLQVNQTIQNLNNFGCTSNDNLNNIIKNSKENLQDNMENLLQTNENKK